MHLIFNRDFYNLRAIKNTINAYNGLACFKILENKKAIRVAVKNISKEVKDVIEDEFYNYVLAEMKNDQNA